MCKLGRCCRICDRKFFLRESFQNYSEQISFYVEEEKIAQECLDEVEHELEAIINQNAEINDKIREEEMRYKAADDDIRVKLEKAQTDYYGMC